MIARPLPVATAADALRVVRALGAHRYVGGRLFLVHALAFDALDISDSFAPLADAIRWARAVLSDPDVDPASKDERLLRAASLEEFAGVLECFWTPGSLADSARARLVRRLDGFGLEAGAHAPFDEEAEEDVHPVLIDAGWELLPLATLDPERHKGVMQAFDEPILFAAACFEEESAIPSQVHLQELPVLGAVELVRGVDPDGVLLEPLILWTEGNDTYQDYVLRGVLRAAKVGQTPA